MNKLEAIKYLFEKYSTVTSTTIDKALESDYYSNQFSISSPYFTEARFKDYMMFLYTSFFNQKYDVDLLTTRVNGILQSVGDYYREIQVSLDDAISLSKTANLADKSNSDHIYSIYFSPSSSYNPEATNAVVEKGIVYGLNKSTDIKSSGGLKISRGNVVATLSEPGNTFECKILNKDNAPFLNSDFIINTGDRFSISGVSKSQGSKEIEVIIDRKEYAAYNSVSIETPIPYIYTLYTSSDGVYYNKIGRQKVLTSLLDLSLDNITDRYFKITVHLPRHTSESRDGYVYSFDVNSMYIHMQQYKDESVYETNDIEINKEGEFISIDTCDNYQNKAVQISYQISIDNDRWKSIKPLRKASIYQDGLRSLIPIGDYNDMRIGILETYQESAGRNVFTTELNSTTIETNSFRYFDNTHLFEESGNYVSVTGVIYEDKEYDFGDMAVLINGVIHTGKVTIYEGIVTIDFPKASFKKLFDSRNISNIEYLGTGTYKLTDINGITTINDPSYLTNGFTIAITIFGIDAILGQEITNDIQYTNSDDTFTINTDTSVKRVYILIRKRIEKIGSVKLRVKMKSLDLYTRPELTRVIFRVA